MITNAGNFKQTMNIGLLTIEQCSSQFSITHRPILNNIKILNGSLNYTHKRHNSSYDKSYIFSKYKPSTKLITRLTRLRCSSTLHSLQDVASLIIDNSNLLVMVGAGLSTASGIPDFRTPGTGLYSNFQQFNLPYPEAIFDINYFAMDPLPFFTLAKDLYPGVNYKPNIGHLFLRLLNDENKLLKLYTQNIDGLERLAGIPSEKLVESHGTFSSATCTLCQKKYDPETLKNHIVNGRVPVICNIDNCMGLVKPDIVFFGENLPNNFWDYMLDVTLADLLIVLGTSLEVYPFANVANAVDKNLPRVLMNRDCVGTFGKRTSDFVVSGDLTSTIWKLAEILGWSEKLMTLEKELNIL